MIILNVRAGLDAAEGLKQIKLLAMRFPGEEELSLVVHPPASVDGDPRVLTLGEAWRYDDSPACRAALSEFGEIEGADPEG